MQRYVESTDVYPGPFPGVFSLVHWFGCLVWLVGWFNFWFVFISGIFGSSDSETEEKKKRAMEGCDAKLSAAKIVVVHVYYEY
jgi:hypothetical protein